MPHPVCHTFLTLVPRLVRALRAAFPSVSLEMVEDAVWGAILPALERPALYDAALAAGEEDLYRLFRCVAWRDLRGALRRHGARLELGVSDETLQAFGLPAGQEVAAGYALRVQELLDDAVDAFGADRPERLRDALEDKVLTGDSDTEIAARHGLRREHVNRAKRYVQRGLWDAALTGEASP